MKKHILIRFPALILSVLLIALPLFSCAKEEIKKEKPKYNEDQTRDPENAFVRNGLEFTLTEDGTYAVTDFTGEGSNAVIPKAVNKIPVTQISAHAFSSASLTSVTVPASVVHIQALAFSGCTKLTSVSFESTQNWHATNNGGSSYTDVDAEFLEDPTTAAIFLTDTLQGYTWVCGEVEVQTPVGTKLTDESSDIVYKVLENGTLELVSCLSSAKSLQIPASYRGMDIVSIGSAAFEYSEVQSVSFASNSKLKEIQDIAFYGCTTLTTVHIPASVTYIGMAAFRSCNNLSKVSFGNPSGWVCTFGRGGRIDRTIATSYLSNPANAAYYLTESDIADFCLERR